MGMLDKQSDDFGETVDPAEGEELTHETALEMYEVIVGYLRQSRLPEREIEIFCFHFSEEISVMLESFYTREEVLEELGVIIIMESKERQGVLEMVWKELTDDYDLDDKTRVDLTNAIVKEVFEGPVLSREATIQLIKGMIREALV